MFVFLATTALGVLMQIESSIQMPNSRIPLLAGMLHCCKGL